MSTNIQKFFKKLKNNKKFYMENFLKIRTKTGELVKFKLNEPQNQSLKEIYEKQISKGKPVRVIWLKARQLGISTFGEGYIFHDTANNAFKNSLIIAHEDKATQNLFSMSKLFLEELPPEIRPMKKYSNESALVFENPTNNEDEKYVNPGLRSKITVATAKNVQTARSNTYHNIHCSEVAFWDDANTLMTGLLQCVPDSPNTTVFLESTANGVGGWFYDFWKRSERGETDYIPIFLAWFTNPEYSREFESKEEKEAFIQNINRVSIDEGGKEVKSEELELIERFNLTYEQMNWRRWCISDKCNGNLETFRQEYPSTPDEAFIVSGRPVFNVTSLREYHRHTSEPIKIGYLKDNPSGKVDFIEDPNGYISIWKEPEQNRFYALGGDVSEGLIQGDYSAGVVISDKFDVCALWHGHIDPDLFGDELVKLAKYYNDAYLGVESNNHGHVTLKSIVKQEYWNIYFQKQYDKITDKITQKIGWLTSSRTKPLMIGKLAEFLREKWLGIKSKLIVSECLTYVRDDSGKTNAQKGAYDDALIATAIALQLILEGLGEDYEPEIPIDDANQPRSSNMGEYDEIGEEIGLDKIEEQEYSI